LSVKSLVIRYLPIVFVLSLGALYGVAGIAFGRVGIRAVGLGMIIVTMILLFIFMMRTWSEYLNRSSRRSGPGDA